MTETVDVRHSMTEAIGTLEAALRKGAGARQIATATIETGIRRQSPGATQELTEIVETYSKTGWELDPLTLRNPRLTTEMSLLPQLLHLHLLLGLY